MLPRPAGPPTLDEVVSDALLDVARRILGYVAGAPDEQRLAVRAALKDWLDVEPAHRPHVWDRMTISMELDAPRGRRRKPDTRTLTAVVHYVDMRGNVAELGRWRVRDLCDGRTGFRIDAQATARDLLDQLRPVTDRDLWDLIDEEDGR